MFYKKGVFEKLHKFHRKTPVSEPQVCNFIKKRLWHRCLPANFAKFLRTFFYRKLLVTASGVFP